MEKIGAIRKRTPGTAGCVHLNNAGAALQTIEVIEAQKKFLDMEAVTGGYELCKLEKGALDRPYFALAELLNCSPSEVAIVQSASTAWSQVFYGIQFREGDRILTSVVEYGSNFLAFLQMAKRRHIAIEIIPETPDGDISIPDLEKMILEGERAPALLAITHIPTSSGRVYNAISVGQIARKYGIPYLLDACQSVGQMPMDVKKIGCDWLSGTSRKFLRGPRGIGFLYASMEAMQWAEPAVIDIHGAEWVRKDEYTLVADAKRYECYERSMAAQVGFGLAIDYTLSLGLDWIWERNQKLASHLRNGLKELPGVKVRDHGRQLCSIVSFTKEGIQPATAVEALQRQGFNLHSSFSTSTRLDFEARQLPSSILRASVHYYNTEEELDSLIQAVKRLSPMVHQTYTAAGLLLGGLLRMA